MNTLILLASFASAARAAFSQITAAAIGRPALRVRQGTTTSEPPSITIGYFSAAETSGTTTWGPVAYGVYTTIGDNTYQQFMTKSSDYFAACSLQLNPPYSSICPIWTACSEGTLLAEGASDPCTYATGTTCYTNLLYTTWGAPSALTNLFCEQVTGSRSWYEEEPPSQVPTLKPTTTSNPASTTSVSSSSENTSFDSTSSRASSAIPSTTSLSGNPTSDPAPASPNHTGAIAGGVVGGVAGLALIAIAAFLLIKRRRRSQTSAPVTAPYHANAPLDGDVPEWIPPASNRFSTQPGVTKPPIATSPMAELPAWMGTPNGSRHEGGA